MTYLSEDPTYLAGALLLFAGAFLVALNLTQRGKYLVYAGVAFGLALSVVAIEWLWITDNERIEQVVYDLRRSVQNSDTDGVLAHMAPTVQYLQGDTALSEDATRALIRANLSHARFEFVRISDLQTSAGQQSRRGKAEFRVFTRGRFDRLGTLQGMTDVGMQVTTWSLGFQETDPGVWKVNRISPVSMPQGILALPGGLPPTDDSHLGLYDGIGLPRTAGSMGRGSGRSGFRQHRLPGENGNRTVPSNGNASAR
jgi:ketosteroid isomerase-like protein